MPTLPTFRDGSTRWVGAAQWCDAHSFCLSTLGVFPKSYERRVFTCLGQQNRRCLCEKRSLVLECASLCIMGTQKKYVYQRVPHSEASSQQFCLHLKTSAGSYSCFSDTSRHAKVPCLFFNVVKNLRGHSKWLIRNSESAWWHGVCINSKNCKHKKKLAINYPKNVHVG